MDQGLDEVDCKSPTDHDPVPDIKADPFITTWNGRKFYLLRPDTSMVCQDDLVEATSQIPRFTGHVGKYSVAEHSMLVFFIVVAMGGTLVEQKQAAIHDLAEAYMNDISTPEKHALIACGLDYDKFRKPIEKAVFEYYGVPYPLSELVDQADHIAFVIEWEHFYKGRLGDHLHNPVGRDLVVPWQFRSWDPPQYECPAEELRYCLRGLFPNA